MQTSEQKNGSQLRICLLIPQRSGQAVTLCPIDTNLYSMSGKTRVPFFTGAADREPIASHGGRNVSEQSGARNSLELPLETVTLTGGRCDRVILPTSFLFPQFQISPYDISSYKAPISEL